MKYCKHGVNRTGGKYVNRSAGKNVSMYAYKRGAGKDGVHERMVCGRALSEQQVTIGVRRKRASAETHQQGEPHRTSGHQRPQARERERPTVEPPCERASASGKGGGTGRECEWTRVRDWW